MDRRRQLPNLAEKVLTTSVLAEMKADNEL